MAKNRYKTSDLLSLSWGEVNKLSRKELAVITSQLGAIANKRIKRLQGNKYYKSSAAYHMFERRDIAKISVRGKSINEIRNQFKLAQQFLNAKTSTIKGVKEYRKQVEERLGGKVSGVNEWSEDMWRNFWTSYNKLMELDSGKVIREQLGSNRVQELLRDEMSNGITYKDIMSNMDAFLSAWREGFTSDSDEFREEFEGFTPFSF